VRVVNARRQVYSLAQMSGLATPEAGEDVTFRLATDELARETWPYRLGPFAALRQSYAVWTTDRALADFLADLYAPMAIAAAEGTLSLSSSDRAATVFRVLPPRPGRSGAILQDTQIIGISHIPGRILSMVQSAINRRVIEQSCLKRLIVHAGAVERDGCALLLPASMESGKTTLTTGLLDHGLSYLSDEAVWITSDMLVEGYLKPLSIDRGSWSVLHHHRPNVPQDLAEYLDEQWQVPAQGFAPIATHSKLAAVAFPRYKAGAATKCEPLSPATALSKALNCVFSPPGELIPTWKVRVLASVFARVPSYELVSGNLAEECEAAEKLLDAHRR
jgi:hypothetical protein